MDVTENFRELSYTECTGKGNDFEFIPMVKMETKHSMEPGGIIG